jgi:adenylyltransferase/sulfurtransferase
LCGRTIELFKPSFRIFDYETICSDCTAKGATKDDFTSDIETKKEEVKSFSLKNSEERILEMSLYDLGVPYFHIVAVSDKAGNYKYYELSGDRDKLLKTVDA